MVTESKAIATITSEKSLDQLKSEIQSLNQFYKGLMQKGTDYDTIPGTPKPTLLKSGAEMLRMRFGFNPEFKISKGLTDIQKGFIEYDVTCSLYRDGSLFAEGVGNANSLESKWRYRWVWATDLPKDFDKTRAYETYGATRKTKQGGIQYRMENENPQDQANTILKIAKKRAFVDAILTATGASRIFTQDVEDMDIVPNEGGDVPVAEAADGAASPPAEGMCPIHNVPWVEREGKYGTFYSHKQGTGYCNKSKGDKELATEAEETPPAQPQSVKQTFKEAVALPMKVLGWKGKELLEYCQKNFDPNLTSLEDLPLLSPENKKTLVKDLNEMVDLKNAQ